jgi:hypothetical protein
VGVQRLQVFRFCAPEARIKDLPIIGSFARQHNEVVVKASVSIMGELNDHLVAIRAKATIEDRIIDHFWHIVLQAQTNALLKPDALENPGWAGPVNVIILRVARFHTSNQKRIKSYRIDIVSKCLHNGRQAA